MLCFGYHTHPARPIPSPECFDAASRQWALIRLTALPETPAAAVSGEYPTRHLIFAINKAPSSARIIVHERYRLQSVALFRQHRQKKQYDQQKQSHVQQY